MEENLQSHAVNSGREDEPSRKFAFGGRVHQYLAAAAVTLGGFSLGNCLGYSSPALANLKSSGDFPQIDNSHLSWISSLVTIGGLLGAALGGFSIDKIGRKNTLIGIGVPFISGWFTIAFAQQIFMIYIGRFLTGLSVGSVSLVGPVYLSEISQPDLRGFLGASFQVTIVVGIFFSFVIGSMTSWNVLAVICGVFPVVFTVFALFLPESPRYLLSLGRANEAMKSLSWFRGCDPENPSNTVLKEMDEIVNSLQAPSEKQSLRSHLINLRSLPVLKPLLITLALMTFKNMCGYQALAFNTVLIFEEAKLGLDAYLSSILAVGVQVAAVILACAFMERVGRRMFLILSFGAMCLSMATLGTFFRMRHEPAYSDVLEGGAGRFVPLACLIIFNAAYSGGAGCLVWTVMSEILPTHIIGFGSGLATTLNWTLSFITTKFFHDLNDSLGIHYTFWLFGGFCALGCFFTFVFVPETKGKSLDEIQRENFQQSGKSSESEAVVA